MKCDKCMGTGEIRIYVASCQGAYFDECHVCGGDGLKNPIVPDELCVSGTEEEITEIARSVPMTTERMAYIIENNLFVIHQGEPMQPVGIRMISGEWKVDFKNYEWQVKLKDCQEPKSAWDEWPGLANKEEAREWLVKYRSTLEKTYIPEKEGWKLTDEELEKLNESLE